MRRGAQRRHRRRWEGNIRRHFKDVGREVVNRIQPTQHNTRWADFMYIYRAFRLVGERFHNKICGCRFVRDAAVWNFRIRLTK
jgi:hypothetical protein